MIRFVPGLRILFLLSLSIFIMFPSFDLPTVRSRASYVHRTTYLDSKNHTEIRIFKKNIFKKIKSIDDCDRN